MVKCDKCKELNAFLKTALQQNTLLNKELKRLECGVRSRDAEIARELRRVMKKSKEEKTPFMQELTCVIETIDVIDELEGKKR